MEQHQPAQNLMSEISPKLKVLVQAKGSFRSSEPFSPRRELDSGYYKAPASPRSGESVSPKRDHFSLKRHLVA